MPELEQEVEYFGDVDVLRHWRWQLERGSGAALCSMRTMPNKPDAATRRRRFDSQSRMSGTGLLIETFVEIASPGKLARRTAWVAHDARLASPKQIPINIIHDR
jgi:hypothetical protein